MGTAMDPSSSRTDADVKQEVLEAQVALDQGDYRTVRRKLRRLTDPGIVVPVELRAEVAKLERTTQNDPAAVALAAGCLVFFIIVVLQYVF